MFWANFYADYFGALVITIIPGLTLLVLFFLRDKIKEPFSMVISTFAMAFIITMPLDLMILIVDPIILSLFDNQFYYSFTDFFRAGYLEEFLKFSVLYFYVAKNYHFDELIDGVVYGAAIGLGYAVAENLGYIYFNRDYEYSELALIRLKPMIVHTLFGIIMGILFAKSAFQLIKNNAGIYLSLFIPIFIHGLHNYSGVSNTIPQLTLLFFWAGMIVILFFLSSMPALKEKYKEKEKIALTNYLFIKVSTTGLVFSIVLSIIFGMIS